MSTIFLGYIFEIIVINNKCTETNTGDLFQWACTGTAEVYGVTKQSET